MAKLERAVASEAVDGLIGLMIEAAKAAVDAAGLSSALEDIGMPSQRVDQLSATFLVRKRKKKEKKLSRK